MLLIGQIWLDHALHCHNYTIVILAITRSDYCGIDLFTRWLCVAESGSTWWLLRETASQSESARHLCSVCASYVLAAFILEHSSQWHYVYIFKSNWKRHVALRQNIKLTMVFLRRFYFLLQYCDFFKFSSSQLLDELFFFHICDENLLIVAKVKLYLLCRNLRRK